MASPALAYVRKVAAPESALLARIRAACESEGLPNVPPETGAALRALAAASAAKRALEVGTLLGYSALWLLAGLPLDGRLDTIERDDANADRAESHFREAGVGSRVAVLRGEALDVLPSLEGPYDLVFLDAAKSEYPAYLDEAARLLRPGGLLLADNCFWQGRVWDPAARDPDTEGVRRFSDAATRPPWRAFTILPVGDGLGAATFRV